MGNNLHFLFIASQLGPYIGGLEVQISTMSKWLLNKGHRVTLLTNSVAKNRDLFPERMRIVECGDQIYRLCFWHKARSVWADLRIERPDIIKSFNLTASWISSILAAQLSPTPRVLFGSYFPYLIPQSRNPLKRATLKLFLKNIRKNFANDSILCMSVEHISMFRRHYGDYKNPIFWPLPVEDPSKNGPVRSPKWGCIVSVGRLAPMKEYNIYMIDVISKLRKKGYAVTWTVYGEGELAGAMRERINTLGQAEAIELKGRLANSQFASAVQQAYVFVGMGTSIIEAALCSVPGVVALAHDSRGLTYGPLYRFRFGNAGELMETPPGTTVEAEIERMLKLREEEYEKEMQRTRDYAMAYTIDGGSMDRFLEIASKASPLKVSYMLFNQYYLLSIIKRLWQKVKLTD